MPDTQLDWGRVPTDMQQRLSEYITLIQELAGPNALALNLFGSITAGSFDAQRDAAANVLVLNEPSLDLIRTLGTHGPTLGNKGIAAPWVMTPTYLQNSCDSFPLELIEIQQNHLTLFGPDLFSPLTFEADHVRLQCERELKSAQLQLQRGLLAAAGEERRLNALAHNIGTELVRMMRGLLWLRDEHQALPGKEVVARVESVFGRKLPGVRTAADRYAQANWDTFEALYHDVHALSEFADAG